MVPVIGSGKLITTPIITDDGQPVTDSSINSTFSDKRSIQWMRALHQIGRYIVSNSLGKGYLVAILPVISKYHFPYNAEASNLPTQLLLCSDSLLSDNPIIC